METPKFHSARLVYRAFDKEADRDFIKQIFSDPYTDMMSGNGSGKPFSAASLDFQCDWFGKCLLGLIACLPLSPSQPTTPGEPIGFLQVAPGAAKTSARRTDVGIVLSAAYQGKGYGPEMMRYVVGWCFDNLGLNKVELGTFGFNVAAQKCYEGVGFVKEGVRREDAWVQGRWVDGLEYGMLRSEWEVLKIGWEKESK